MLDINLSGRVALVTGGSRGIGRATCSALAAQGAAIAVHYREQAEAAAAVVAEIEAAGGRAVAIAGDLGQPEVAAQLVTDTLAAFGRLDILVNNAAIFTDGRVAEMSDALWDETINLNLSAVFRTIRAALPHLTAHGWGRIINLTSQGAYTGSSLHAHYTAAKAALSGLTYSLAKELGKSGVTVNLVAPGRIETDMLMNRGDLRLDDWLKQTPMGRLGQAEEVAAAIVFLASPAASYITGATLHVNGGMLMS
jgi:3-oxoacyl-[acyl-carrier protein] reductase